jgi:hypothetical protein
LEADAFPSCGTRIARIAADLVGSIAGTITGGTGRFSNATGSFTFSLVFDTATAHSFAEIEGVIHYAGK